MQQGERFTMLDPPSLPVKPDFPNRLKFCIVGVAVGIGLGCLVVFLFEFLDDRLHSEKEMKSLLSMQVISEIPEVQSPSDLLSQKKRLAWGWALTAVVCVVIVMGSAYSYLRG
jgi:polysaccharide biosynthesis transport protein